MRFYIKIGLYSLANAAHDQKESFSLEELNLCLVSDKKHDPRKVIEDHFYINGI